MPYLATAFPLLSVESKFGIKKILGSFGTFFRKIK